MGVQRERATLAGCSLPALKPTARPFFWLLHPCVGSMYIPMSACEVVFNSRPRPSGISGRPNASQGTLRACTQYFPWLRAWVTFVLCTRPQRVKQKKGNCVFVPVCRSPCGNFTRIPFLSAGWARKLWITDPLFIQVFPSPLVRDHHHCSEGVINVSHQKPRQSQADETPD